MNRPRKIISLVLFLIMLTQGLILTAPATAAAKPSTPQATIKFINGTYPVPSTDPYTGQTSTILAGNYSIELKIKNQAISDPDNQIYYNIRIKPRYDVSGIWAELYGVWYYISLNNGDGTFEYGYFISAYAPAQSASDYTTITVTLETTTVYGKTGTYYHIPTYYNSTDPIPDGGEVDIQVQRLVGHATQRWVSRSPFTTTVGGYMEDAVAFDAASDWSGTQTLTIGNRVTPSETLAPGEPQTSIDPLATSAYSNWQVNDLVIVVAAASAVIIVAIIAIAALLIKRAKTQTTTPLPN